MAKPNLTKFGKLEKDGLYIVKIRGNLSMEMAREIQTSFQKLQEKFGVGFILMGDNMEILNPESLYQSVQFITFLERCMAAWDKRPRLVV